MRGSDEASGALFSFVDLAERLPAWRPLRKIGQAVTDALASLDAGFQALYVDFGRPLIAPERLIRASPALPQNPDRAHRQHPIEIVDFFGAAVRVPGADPLDPACRIGAPEGRADPRCAGPSGFVPQMKDAGRPNPDGQADGRADGRLNLRMDNPGVRFLGAYRPAGQHPSHR